MNSGLANPANGTVAVFGAAGHTGRFVVAELQRRGITPIAIARDIAALEARYPQGGVLLRAATVDDAKSLDSALDGARAVINCAGPFLETAEPVAAAALRAKSHYLDVTAEQPSARTILDKFDAGARDAGVAFVPAMGFFGGLADLMVTAALGDWKNADSIEIMIGLDSWHPTRGTRVTGERNTSQRMVVSGGQLIPWLSPAPERVWDFGSRLGVQTVVEVPLSEIILIARHIETAELHNYISAIALADIRDPSTPAPKAADAQGRSPQQFVVHVVVTKGKERRRAVARGRDIYAFTAPLVCEAAERLLNGKFKRPGANAPGAILDARDMLEALTLDQLTFETKDI